jgi:hypothetical protein
LKTLREALQRETWNDRDGETVLTVDEAILALRQWLADEGLVVVPGEATFGMYDATSKHCEDVLKAGEPPNPFRVWSLMISAAPDALKAFDGVPPSPGAITGIRKAETPCSDCIDGWCQMNCGPRVG